MCSSASAAKQSKMSAVNAEGRHMDYSEGLFEQTGEGAPISDTHEQHSGMRSVQNLEAVINEGLRVALLEKTPDDSLDVLLEHLGKALNGERTYIFEQNESGCDDNTYEWAAESPSGGVRQLVSEFQHRQAYCHRESGKHSGNGSPSV